jgi:hypothetical protein
MRRGMSVAEVMVATIIGVLLLVVVYNILNSGMIRGDELTEEHRLLVDMRGVIDNMGRDVANAHLVLPPPARQDLRHVLTLGCYTKGEMTTRLAGNRAQNFPFSEPTGSTTNIENTLTRIIYSLDAEKQTITRSEQEGRVIGSNEGRGERLTKYEWAAGSSPAKERRLAGNVTKFDLSYFGYESTGPMLYTTDGALPRTICVGLAITGEFSKGAYARRSGVNVTRRLPKVEIVTKFWPARRQSDAVYPEYTSSADDDLRY